MAEGEEFEVTESPAFVLARGDSPGGCRNGPAIRDSDLRSSPFGRQSASQIPSYLPFALLRSDGAAGRDAAQQWPWRESRGSISPHLQRRVRASKSLNCWQVADLAGSVPWRELIEVNPDRPMPEGHTLQYNLTQCLAGVGPGDTSLIFTFALASKSFTAYPMSS